MALFHELNPSLMDVVAICLCFITIWSIVVPRAWGLEANTDSALALVARPLIDLGGLGPSSGCCGGLESDSASNLTHPACCS